MKSLNFSQISAGRNIRVTDFCRNQNHRCDSSTQVGVRERQIKEAHSKTTNRIDSRFGRSPLVDLSNQHLEWFPMPFPTGNVVPTAHEISQLTTLMRAHSDFGLQIFEPLVSDLAAELSSSLRETAGVARTANPRALSFNLELPVIGATRVDVVVDNKRGLILDLLPLNQELLVDPSIARAAFLQLATKLAANRDIFCVRCRTYCFNWTGSADYDEGEDSLR